MLNLLSPLAWMIGFVGHMCLFTASLFGAMVFDGRPTHGHQVIASVLYVLAGNFSACAFSRAYHAFCMKRGERLHRKHWPDRGSHPCALCGTTIESGDDAIFCPKCSRPPTDDAKHDARRHEP